MAWQPKCGPAPFCHAHSHISEEPLLYLMFICPLALPPWWSSKNIMWHIMPWICANITLCLYIWIYNLSNITCHHHNFCVRNRSRLHIMHVWHPRQRAGIAIACPVDSLAHRATASCTTIVHPPSCQPGPSGNRQLHDHSAPPAASLAHRATASCTPSSHPLCNHPAASWTLAQPLGSPSVHTPAPPSPVPSNLWLTSPFPPTSQMKTKPGCQCLNVCLINCELLLIVGMISV